MLLHVCGSLRCEGSGVFSRIFFFFFIVKIKTFTIKYIFTEHNVDKLREHLQ